MGTPFMLERLDRDYGKRKNIYTLPNPDQTKVLQLTWDTFGAGMEVLKEQIKLGYGRDLVVDACIGINEAGLVMATLGGSEQVFGRKKIGYIRLGEPRWPAMSSDSFFPELPPRPTIMLTDSQLKSGKGVNVALKRIHERYDHPLVYFAVFGAMTEEPDLIIESLDDLVAAERLKDPEATKQLEDLVHVGENSLTIKACPTPRDRIFGCNRP